jgi:hypothetical protein
MKSHRRRWDRPEGASKNIGRISWKANFQAKPNGTPRRKLRKLILVSLMLKALGTKSLPKWGSMIQKGSQFICSFICQTPKFICRGKSKFFQLLGETRFFIQVKSISLPLKKKWKSDRAFFMSWRPWALLRFTFNCNWQQRQTLKRAYSCLCKPSEV